MSYRLSFCFSSCPSGAWKSCTRRLFCTDSIDSIDFPCSGWLSQHSPLCQEWNQGPRTTVSLINLWLAQDSRDDGIGLKKKKKKIVEIWKRAPKVQKCRYKRKCNSTGERTAVPGKENWHLNTGLIKVYAVPFLSMIPSPSHDNSKAGF